MLKKIISLFIIFISAIALSSCRGREVLLFLNWGEYIDEDMIAAFEKKYNCLVLMDLAESNELFYSKVRAGTTIYDVVAPSDYMVEKMYKNDLILELDFTKLNSYSPSSDNIRPGVKHIMSDMQDGYGDEIVNYFVPYLWGTWGLMYRTDKEGLRDSIINSESSFAPLFNRDILPAGTKVSMYDSHQHAYYAASKYLGYSVVDELTHRKLDSIERLVKDMHFDAWGTDNLKKDIVAGNLDLGFMWTGDFLYYYCEQIAKTVLGAYIDGIIELSDMPSMIDALASEEAKYTKNGHEYKINFDLFIPEDTISFVDSFVITKDSQHTELAYKFIDFMTSNNQMVNDSKVDPAFSNAYYVCYDTPYNNVYDEIMGLKDPNKFNEEIIKDLHKDNNPFDSSLYWGLYDYANAVAFSKYYPKTGEKGHKLNSFSRSYVDIINTTFYNARI